MDGTDREGLKIDIDIREDGIYCVIDREDASVPVDRAYILELVESYRIKDVDFTVLNDISNQTGEHFELKLSGATSIDQSDESVEITTSRDKMEAYATLIPPGFKGKLLTTQDVIEKLKSAGVVHGIDEETVKSLIDEHVCQVKRTVARGTPSVSGQDGSIEYLVKKNETANKPKVMEDGTVDFHDLNYFVAISKGQELVKSHPAVSGTDGINVMGEIIPFKAGKPAPKIPKGKNVVLSDDESCLYADTDGHLDVLDGRISVSPVLEILTDVGTPTGDINFNGAVTIRGGVLNGYSVTATEGIEVYGPVEGATITSAGDIVLYKGIQGGGKAVITSEGNLMINFAENATLNSGGNLIANAILNCDVKCFGELCVEGKKGALVGGNIQVGHSIKASVLGSPMAVPTNIVVGNSPRVLDELDKASASLTQSLAEFDKVGALVDGLTKLNEQGKLTDEKKPFLVKAIQAKVHCRAQISALKEKIDSLSGKLTGNTGFIQVKKRVYLGVKITIGHASLYIDDEMDGKVFKNIDGIVMILSEQSLS